MIYYTVTNIISFQYFIVTWCRYRILYSVNKKLIRMLAISHRSNERQVKCNPKDPKIEQYNKRRNDLNFYTYIGHCTIFCLLRSCVDCGAKFVAALAMEGHSKSRTRREQLIIIAKEWLGSLATNLEFCVTCHSPTTFPHKQLSYCSFIVFLILALSERQSIMST